MKNYTIITLSILVTLSFFVTVQPTSAALELSNQDDVAVWTAQNNDQLLITDTSNPSLGIPYSPFDSTLETAIDEIGIYSIEDGITQRLTLLGLINNTDLNSQDVESGTLTFQLDNSLWSAIYAPTGSSETFSLELGEAGQFGFYYAFYEIDRITREVLIDQVRLTENKYVNVNQEQNPVYLINFDSTQAKIEPPMPVPIPTTFLLLFSGITGLISIRSRSRKI